MLWEGWEGWGAKERRVWLRSERVAGLHLELLGRVIIGSSCIIGSSVIIRSPYRLIHSFFAMSLLRHSCESRFPCRTTAVLHGYNL